MTWTELEELIKDTVENIRFAQLELGSLGYSEKVKESVKNVKTLCNYMFADGKIDIDKDIRRIDDYAKELHTNTINYIQSNDDIKRVLYEDSKVEYDKEPASLKQLSVELTRIEYDAIKITNIISQYFARKDKQPEPKHKIIKEPKTFRDRIAGNVDADELIAKLHTLMDNRSGKNALVYLVVCINDGKIARPTFAQTIKEFPNICKSANYYRYTDIGMYTKEEKEAAKKALSR